MPPSEVHDPKVREAMNTLLRMFKEENLPKVARAVFRGKSIPSDSWSFLNRLLMLLNNTEDARGFRQWHEVGRYVSKGSKAFYILGPLHKKVIKERITESGELITEEVSILKGFKAIAVFRFEDSDGAPLIKENYEVNIPCEFNGIIKELGLTVVPKRFCGAAYGSYNLHTKQIELASPDIEVFLHELAHAVDDKLHCLKGGQRSDQEVTAEYSAAVIGHLMGYKIPLGNVREYITNYSFKELLNQLSRIEEVVNFIIERTQATTISQRAMLQ